jgi:hypothetical protein
MFGIGTVAGQENEYLGIRAPEPSQNGTVPQTLLFGIPSFPIFQMLIVK